MTKSPQGGTIAKQRKALVITPLLVLVPPAATATVSRRVALSALAWHFAMALTINTAKKQDVSEYMYYLFGTIYTTPSM